MINRLVVFLLVCFTAYSQDTLHWTDFGDCIENLPQLKVKTDIAITEEQLPELMVVLVDVDIHGEIVRMDNEIRYRGSEDVELSPSMLNQLMAIPFTPANYKGSPVNCTIPLVLKRDGDAYLIVSNIVEVGTYDLFVGDEVYDITPFVSPGKNHSIIYKGFGRGTGSFFIKTGDREEKILSSYLRYGPRVKWESNDVAEIKIATGSPNYHCYYYSVKRAFLSKSVNLTFAVDSDRLWVANWYMDRILFVDLLNDKLLLDYSMEDYPETFQFGPGRYSGEFVDDHTFIFKAPTHDLELIINLNESNLGK